MLESRDLGIDLGTSHIRIYLSGGGIVLREPSVAAVARATGQLIAVGTEAEDLFGRETPDTLVVRPLRAGVIDNYDVTARMLALFLRRVSGRHFLRKPRAVVCIPSRVSEAEKRLIVEAAIEAGCRCAFLIEEPVAAAIGAGEDMESGNGLFVLDIGAGTTDIALISHGSVVLSDSVRVAGDALTESLMRYMQNKHGLFIGPRYAEEIKCAYGAAFPEKEQRVLDVKGRSLASGLPESVPVGSNELVESLLSPLSVIMEHARALFACTPPELARDVAENGVLLTGGGAKLSGLAKYVSDAVGVPCRAAEDPENCVARGAGAAVENLSRYSGAVYAYRRGDYRNA